MPLAKQIIGFYGAAKLEVLHRSLAGILRYTEDVGGFVVRDFRVAPADDKGSYVPPPWRGQADGVVVSVGRFDSKSDKGTADWVLSGGVPAVSVAADWKDPRIPCLHVDTESLAEMAADHLVECGCESFLYLGFAKSTGSALRGRAFEEALATLGKELVQCPIAQRLEGVPGDVDLLWRETELRQHLLELRKPVGVWALNDVFACGVSRLCLEMGLAIPDAVKLLGVGDTSVARNYNPAISSIRTPGEQIGYLAMRNLHALLLGRRISRKELGIPATELAARDSTLVEERSSFDVQHAVDYIARHACTGISVAQLAQRMHMSRRSFELKFRAFVGRTPGDEIQRIRLERAKTLLRQTQLSLTRITSMVGLGETATLSKFFRRLTGMTPSAYRALPPQKSTTAPKAKHRKRKRPCN